MWRSNDITPSGQSVSTHRRGQMTEQFRLALGLLALLATLTQTGCNAAQTAMITVLEQPSLEVGIERLREVEWAAALSRFYMKEARVGATSTWPAKLNQIDPKMEREYYDSMHQKGVYAPKSRYILPVRMFAYHLDRLKPQVRGDYANFFEAFKVLVGKAGGNVQAAYQDWRLIAAQIADAEGRIEDLKTKNSVKGVSEADKNANKAQVTKLSTSIGPLTSASDAKFDKLIHEINTLSGQKPSVINPTKMKLAVNLQAIAANVAALQDLAALSGTISVVQMARALPDAPGELKALISRWAAEGIPDAPEKAKSLFSDIVSVPGRIGELGSLMGRDAKFNRAMAKCLGSWTGITCAEPVIQSMSSAADGVVPARRK